MEVVLILDSVDKDETRGGRPIYRSLSPDEADELAAMLRHHASAQRRRWASL